MIIPDIHLIFDLIFDLISHSYPARGEGCAPELDRDVRRHDRVRVLVNKVLAVDALVSEVAKAGAPVDPVRRHLRQVLASSGSDQLKCCKAFANVGLLSAVAAPMFVSNY